MKRSKSKRAPVDRFSEKYEVVTESGCWLWTASCNKRGYGQIAMPGRPVLAHRLSWELAEGEIPDGVHVLHKCDTPSCVNPAHLFLGTDLDNVRDMIGKGRYSRHKRPSGQRHGMARITDEVAVAIFRSEGTAVSVAVRFGVCKSTVDHIRSGRQWSEVTGKTHTRKQDAD